MIQLLLYENGTPSLTRVLAVLSFLLFAGVSVYLIITHQTWVHYDIFGTLTAGGGLATQVGNKLINSRLNSNSGEFPNKGA